MAAHPALVSLRDSVDLTFYDQPLGDKAATELQDFDGLCLIRERMALPAELIDQLKKLRFIAFTGARNPSLDQAAAKARGIPVSNTPGGPAKASTAEQTWALLLGAVKQLANAQSGMQSGNWRADRENRRYPLPSMLEGEQLGLLGLGEIGSRVARVAQAFGMDVVAWSQNLTDERANECGVKRVSKQALFESSRFISLHLVLSDRTRGVVGTDEFAAMRSDSVLVNTSRAGLIDTDALIQGMQAGKPAQVGLDVFPSEPLSPADPMHQLLTMPNVTLSPHLGYVSERIFDAFGSGLAEVVASWRDGSPARVINDV